MPVLFSYIIPASTLKQKKLKGQPFVWNNKLMLKFHNRLPKNNTFVYSIAKGKIKVKKPFLVFSLKSVIMQLLTENSININVRIVILSLTGKKRLSLELFKEEEKYPGSISLSAGSCTKCTVCSRETGEPCLYPDKMRYSIESLGGNVGLTIEKLMGLRLEWMEEGRLPHHFVLVCGLLLP